MWRASRIDIRKDLKVFKSSHSFVIATPFTSGERCDTIVSVSVATVPVHVLNDSQIRLHTLDSNAQFLNFMIFPIPALVECQAGIDRTTRGNVGLVGCVTLVRVEVDARICSLSRSVHVSGCLSIKR